MGGLFGLSKKKLVLIHQHLLHRVTSDPDEIDPFHRHRNLHDFPVKNSGMKQLPGYTEHPCLMAFRPPDDILPLAKTKVLSKQ